MKRILSIAVCCLFLSMAGSLRAQSTTSGRALPPGMGVPPSASGTKETFTLKKFKEKKGAKKFKREKPLKSINKYNPKKAARRVNRH